MQEITDQSLRKLYEIKKYGKTLNNNLGTDSQNNEEN